MIYPVGAWALLAAAVVVALLRQRQLRHAVRRLEVEPFDTATGLMHQTALGVVLQREVDLSVAIGRRLAVVAFELQCDDPDLALSALASSRRLHETAIRTGRSRAAIALWVDGVPDATMAVMRLCGIVAQHCRALSAGIALAPDDGTNAHELLQLATGRAEPYPVPAPLG